ncbi:hypothetical protein ACO0QE_000473 [Hanseniaspora vineae]
MPVVANSSNSFRTARWLQKAGYAPQVFVFRNLESGQVCYSQLPTINPRYVNKLQFKQCNKLNRTPDFKRRDIWKAMCVINLTTYKDSIQVFQNLNRLRFLRDVQYKKQNDELRKKHCGNVFQDGRYAPVFAQEAVADIKESLLKSGIEFSKVNGNEITLHWEDEWRKGDLDMFWNNDLPQVKHEMIERTLNTGREESVILKKLGDLAKLNWNVADDDVVFKKMLSKEKTITA